MESSPHASQSEILISNSAYAAALCVLYYDYALTFEDEREFFWQEPFGRHSLFFFLNRYFSFFGNIALLAMRYAYTLTSSCPHWQLPHQLVIVAPGLLVMAILFFRTYALYNQDRRVLWLLSLTYVTGTLASLAGVLYGQQVTGPPPDPNFSCVTQIPEEQVQRTMIGWYILLTFDLLVLGLTLARTWRFPRTGEGLPQIIRRDGAAYFAIMACLNIANIVTLQTFPPYTRGCLGTLSSTVSVALLSRLQINLQRPTPQTYFTTEAGAGDMLQDTFSLGAIDWKRDVECAL